MSTIKNNPIMKGASGMLGNVVVYREHRGKLIMSNRPKTSGILTPNQKQAKSRFLRAVKYAKKQIADPVAKKEYTPSPDSRFTSAYSMAVADYLTPPVIASVDMSHYAGAAGDKILIKASDDFKVTSVNVSILKADGTLIEQGDAVLLADAIDDYEYAATVAFPKAAGTKVIVAVRDKPGNVTTAESVL